MFYTVLLQLKTWSNSHSASLFNVCSGNHFSSFVTLQKFKCTLEREMILTKCDCDDSFHERLLDLFFTLLSKIQFSSIMFRASEQSQPSPGQLWNWGSLWCRNKISYLLSYRFSRRRSLSEWGKRSRTSGGRSRSLSWVWHSGPGPELTGARGGSGLGAGSDWPMWGAGEMVWDMRWFTPALTATGLSR